MLVRLSSADPTPAGGGWGRLLLETLSRGYLAGLLTLVACAVLPTVLGWQASVIVSGSMEPHIDVGDVVLTTGLKTDAPVPVGRVVTFTRPAAASASGRETIVMHRIVSAKDNETYVTAGDANADVDSTTIVREQITGQGRLLVPWVGLPARWAATGERKSVV